MSYGYCPICLSKGVGRERSPDGNDYCEKGHIYPSKKSLQRPTTDNAESLRAENERLKGEIVDRQGTEESLTKWVADLGEEVDRLKGEVDALKGEIASDDAPRLRGLLTVLDMYANHQHLCSKKCTCGLTRTRADIERLLKSDTPKVKKG